jgi:hypothetical protein
MDDALIQDTLDVEARAMAAVQMRLLVAADFRLWIQPEALQDAAAALARAGGGQLLAAVQAQVACCLSEFEEVDALCCLPAHARAAPAAGAQPQAVLVAPDVASAGTGVSDQSLYACASSSFASCSTSTGSASAGQPVASKAAASSPAGGVQHVHGRSPHAAGSASGFHGGHDAPARAPHGSVHTAVLPWAGAARRSLRADAMGSANSSSSTTRSTAKDQLLQLASQEQRVGRKRRLPNQSTVGEGMPPKVPTQQPQQQRLLPGALGSSVLAGGQQLLMHVLRRAQTAAQRLGCSRRQ